MLGVVQFRPERGERAANLTRLERLVRDALEAGVKLLVLPEMAAAGYLFSNTEAVRPVAEDLDGPTLEALAPLAREWGAWIVFGFAEVSRGRFFNAAQAVGPDGKRAAHYRKCCLHDTDAPWAEPGDLEYPFFDTPWGTATIGICMDMNDSMFIRRIAARQPAIVCFPTNWIDEGFDFIHDYWSARLQGFEGVLLASDRWGEEDDVRFWGRSAIIQRGRILVAAPAEGDGWCAVDPTTRATRSAFITQEQ